MNKMITQRDLIKPLKKLAKVPEAQLGGVACFIIKNNAIISSGVNYNPTGEPMEHKVGSKLVTRPEVIHAELAAIDAAEKNAVDITHATLFVTMSPCIKCASNIAVTGICEVTYLYDWWDKAALDILHEAGITTKKIEEKI